MADDPTEKRLFSELHPQLGEKPFESFDIEDFSMEDALAILHALRGSLVQVRELESALLRQKKHENLFELGKHEYLVRHYLPYRELLYPSEGTPEHVVEGSSRRRVRQFSGFEHLPEEPPPESDEEADRRIESIREALDRSRALGERAQEGIDSLRQRSSSIQS